MPEYGARLRGPVIKPRSSVELVRIRFRFRSVHLSCSRHVRPGFPLFRPSARKLNEEALENTVQTGPKGICCTKDAYAPGPDCFYMATL
jgi:hypothetical protein